MNESPVSPLSTRKVKLADQLVDGDEEEDLEVDLLVLILRCSEARGHLCERYLSPLRRVDSTI